MGNVLNLVLDHDLIMLNPTYRLRNIYSKKQLIKDKCAVHRIDPLSREELSLLLQRFQEYFPKHYTLALTLSRTRMML